MQEEVWQSHQSTNNAKGSWRKRLLGSTDVLGLMLTWIHMPAYHIMLMLTFAPGPATLSVYLKEGRYCLLRAFKCYPAALVLWQDGA